MRKQTIRGDRIRLLSSEELRDPNKVAPVDRFELLEYVNQLNSRGPDGKFWTCTVLYNTVIWCQTDDETYPNAMFAVYEGVLS